MTGHTRTALAVASACLVLLGAAEARAQTPRIAPQARFHFVDEWTIGPLVVQRWVRDAAPAIAPSGVCECITVVYAGGRRVLRIGHGEPAATTIDDPSGRDINGDGSPDLVVQRWTGGAHCCYSTTVYSMEAPPRELVSVRTGTCRTSFEDLDGDGRLEMMTCDDRWANEYCSFDESPFPRVVFFYDTSARRYRPATPRYASHHRDQLAAALGEAQAWLLENGGTDSGRDKCRLLAPVLGLMYSGRFDDGLLLLRSLYDSPDRDAFERETVARVQASPFWTASDRP